MTQDNVKSTIFFKNIEQTLRLCIRYKYYSAYPTIIPVSVSNIPARAMQSIETIYIHEAVLRIVGRLVY